MTLAQVGGNARHHRVIELALADRQRQQQMEKGRQQGFHGGDALQRGGRLVTSARLIGDKNEYQADDPGAGCPGQLDEKQVKGEVHPGGAHAGFPLAVVVGKGH